LNIATRNLPANISRAVLAGQKSSAILDSSLLFIYTSSIVLLLLLVFQENGNFTGFHHKQKSLYAALNRDIWAAISYMVVISP